MVRLEGDNKVVSESLVVTTELSNQTILISASSLEDTVTSSHVMLEIEIVLKCETFCET